jgi:reductive dehalogenase
MTRIKHQNQPTTSISGDTQRVDARNTAYGLAARGEYGTAAQKGVQRILPEIYPISAAQKDVLDFMAQIPQNGTAPDRAPVTNAPQELTDHIKSLGYFLKADQMATCHVPQSAYYSHDGTGKPVEPRFKNAIVIVMAKHLPTEKASSGTDWMGDPISFQAYQQVGLVTETIANYVRRLGWEATPHYGPSFLNKYRVLMPPLILAAGIGEVSRTGIILSPYFGLAYKAGAVLTDMPIAPDQPIDFGIQDFCQHCGICAENCPSNAISHGDKVIYNGYETWKLDTQRCASYNFTKKTGTLCNRCVKSCPWSQPQTWPHNLVRSLVSRSKLARWGAVKAAQLLDFGADHPDDKWWFDLRYDENGTLLEDIPKK